MLNAAQRLKFSLKKLDQYYVRRQRFAPWAESTSSLKTWRDFYKVGVTAIQAYTPLARLALDAITTERIADFASHRQAQGMKVATVNASLRILRRVLRIAEEWGELAKVPKIKLLPGEQHRERVITPEEEARYLCICKPAFGRDRNGARGYRASPGRILQALVGFNYLGQWSQWNTAGNARQD